MTENEIKDVFVQAVNQLIGNKEEILNNIVVLKQRLTDTGSMEKNVMRWNWT